MYFYVSVPKIKILRKFLFYYKMAITLDELLTLHLFNIGINLVNFTIDDILFNNYNSIYVFIDISSTDTLFLDVRISIHDTLNDLFLEIHSNYDDGPYFTNLTFGQSMGEQHTIDFNQFLNSLNGEEKQLAVDTLYTTFDEYVDFFDIRDILHVTYQRGFDIHSETIKDIHPNTFLENIDYIYNSFKKLSADENIFVQNDEYDHQSQNGDFFQILDIGYTIE